MATQLDHELAKLRQGDHLCPIHENLVEQTASAVAFIAAGLRSGERCIYVANDSPLEELVRRFAALGVSVAQEAEKGSLQIAAKHDVYLRAGKFDARGMLDYLAECESRAVAEGYTDLIPIAAMDENGIVVYLYLRGLGLPLKPLTAGYFINSGEIQIHCDAEYMVDQ